MSDFSWLEDQIRTVKTNNFFVVDGPVSKSLRKRIETTPLGVPSSYKSLAIQFGNAKLYCSRQRYIVEVFAAPRETKSAEEEELLQFGKTDESPGFFKIIGKFLSEICNIFFAIVSRSNEFPLPML